MLQPSGLLVQSAACRIDNLTSIDCESAVTRSNPWPCADPEIFVRGVQARRPENSLDNVVFYNLQRRSNGFIAENLYFSKDPEGGGTTFSRGGGPTFSRKGVQLLIYIKPI